MAGKAAELWKMSRRSRLWEFCCKWTQSACKMTLTTTNDTPIPPRATRLIFEPLIVLSRDRPYVSSIGHVSQPNLHSLYSAASFIGPSSIATLQHCRYHQYRLFRPSHARLAKSRRDDDHLHWKGRLSRWPSHRFLRDEKHSSCDLSLRASSYWDGSCNLLLLTSSTRTP